MTFNFVLLLAVLQTVPSPKVDSPAPSAKVESPAPAPKAESPAPASVASTLYTVGPQDVLTITVFEQPQLTARYEVEADGTFAFPLIGRIKALGLSLRAVEDEVRNRLSRGYLKNPQLTVAIDQYRSQQIFMMGEVQRPANLQFTGSMSLIEALARAGTMTERAGPEALIIRPRPGGGAIDPVQIARGGGSHDAEVIRVDLQTLQRGALTQNIQLRGGDTVFVPRAATVFVSGQVKAPGEYVVRREMTVRQVLALAGGVTDRGSNRRIQIMRRLEGEERTTGASLEDQVQAGDTIIVRDRLF
jgi:polysaccharide biosynthesis/export protein